MALRNGNLLLSAEPSGMFPVNRSEGRGQTKSNPKDVLKGKKDNVYPNYVMVTNPGDKPGANVHN